MSVSLRATDIITIGQITILGMLSWIIPERHWVSVAQHVAFIMAQLRPDRANTDRQLRQTLFAKRFDAAALNRHEKLLLTHTWIARMQGYREYHPSGWHREIQVNGREYIDEGLEAGHGVVLWVAGFVYSDLVTKKGLYGAGYRISHLSRPFHNYSSTKFGIAFLNPVWTRIEERYLAERVVILDADDSTAKLQLLRHRLRDNRVISILVGQQAKRTVTVDFLNTELKLATGPLHLARTSKAVLLPVFTVQDEAGTLVINVEGPLIRGVENSCQEWPYESIAKRYAERLEHHVIRYPDQWHPKSLRC